MSFIIMYNYATVIEILVWVSLYHFASFGLKMRGGGGGGPKRGGLPQEKGWFQPWKKNVNIVNRR